MSALLKKRAKERAAAQERRLRGEDVSGDEGGEEVDELAVYKVRVGMCFVYSSGFNDCVPFRLRGVDKELRRFVIGDLVR